MISAKSFEFLSISHHNTNEDSAVTDLDFSDGSESPPDYEEVADVAQRQEMIFNIHTDTLYSKTSSDSGSLELSSDPVTKAKRAAAGRGRWGGSRATSTPARRTR